MFLVNRHLWNCEMQKRCRYLYRKINRASGGHAPFTLSHNSGWIIRGISNRECLLRRGESNVRFSNAVSAIVCSVRPCGEHKCILKFLVLPTERSGNWRGSHGNIFCFSLCFSPGDVCARMSVITPRPYFFAAWQRRRFVIIPVKFKQEILFSLCAWRGGGMIRNETARAHLFYEY